MTDISNSRLEEIALYGAQYNTREAREMAKELLKYREAKPVAWAVRMDLNQRWLLPTFTSEESAKEQDARVDGGGVVPLYAR